MESIFDKAAGLTETGIGANISPEDKAFIAMYNAGRGLIDCINFYVKRYENDKDCFACFIAGKLYFIKKDYINALNYFEKFCDSVDENTISIFRHIDIREVTLDWETLKGIKIDVLCIVANMYQNENGAKKDINKIIYYYEQSSILDNANAFVELGKIYKSDSDTDRDYNKSFMYYKKAVDLGKDDIAKDLIDTFLEGYGIEVDIDTIIEYAKKAKIGEDKIYKKFGDLYRDGKGIEQNIEKAIEYYKQGKIDESIYCKELGDLYNKGKYIKRNDSLAFQYYAKAKYKDGLVERYKLIQLGNYCFNYHRNKDIDINKFVECYKKAGVEYLDIYHTLWYMMKGNYFNCFSFRDSRQYNFKADKFIPKEIEQFIEHFRCFGFTDAMIYEQLGNLFCEARYEMDKQHYMPLIIELAKYYYKKAGRDEFLAYYNTECGSLYVESKAEKKAIEQYQQSAEMVIAIPM